MGESHLERRSGTEDRGRLASVLRECGSMLVAYSGGVDSALLAHEAVAVLGRDRVLAVTGVSPSLAGEQLATAARVARRFGIPWRRLETRELENGRYAANPRTRCYYCKTELYARLVKLAQREGFRVVADGTNASDPADHRPGMRAAKEWGVRSPLREAGLTKAAIRRISREVGLPTWDAPASPCLASRLPHGVHVTPERLRQVEAAEGVLRVLGFGGDLRVRHHAGVGRLELESGEIPRWTDPALRREVGRRLLNLGFQSVLLDLAGYRSGSVGGSGTTEAVGRSGEGGEGTDPRARAAARHRLRSWLRRDVHPAAELVVLGPEEEIAGLSLPEGGIESALRARARILRRTRAEGFRFTALVLAARRPGLPVLSPGPPATG